MAFTIRNFRWGDMPELVALINLSSRADGDEFVMTEENLRHQFNSPGADPEKDGFQAVTPEGKLAGGSFVRLMLDGGRGLSNGVVHPAYRGRGIGTALLRAGDAYLMKRAEADKPGDFPIFMQRFIPATNAAAKTLLQAEGYYAARHFYIMRIGLETPPEPPQFPAGVVLRPFDIGRDGRAVYEAYLDSFSEHWGFMPIPYDAWQHMFHDRSRHDHSLWAIATAGDEIAGISINRIWGQDQPDTGWVDILGVRSPWRKQGLGAALLRESFARFKARGMTVAGLNVDAANATGAVGLYERVGMQVYRQQTAYRKVLRGCAEDIQE